MRRNRLLRALILLVVFLSAACSAPEATTLPTLAPPANAPLAAPSPPPTARDGVAVATAPSTAEAAEQPSLDPTRVYCQQTGMMGLGACAAQFGTPPPTPALPLDQAIGQLKGRLVLYMRFPNMIMLGDADSGASAWLNGTVCPPNRTLSIDAEWSADGRFIAFICQDLTYTAAAYLLDLETAETRQLAQGQAVAFEWSPQGSRLLIAEQSKQQRGYLLDAATGTTTKLPAGPLWIQHGYPPQPVGQVLPGDTWHLEKGAAAMAWSPDGSRIAIITDKLYVLDADEQHRAGDTLPVLMSFATSSIFQPGWSHDQRFLYLVVPHQNHNNSLSPSSMYGAIGLRVEISTGVFTNTYPLEPIWSPDGTKYLTTPLARDTNGPWALYQADGTEIRALPDAVLSWSLAWAPDSQAIVMQPWRSIGGQIIMLNMAGQERVIITTRDSLMFAQGAGSPISPDGQLIVFTQELSDLPINRQAHVMIYDIGGHEQMRFEGTQASWQPRPTG